MKNSLLITIAIFTLAGSVAQAAIEEHYEENSIKIQKAGAYEKDKHVIIEVGNNVTFKINIYKDEFFGQTTISANANIDNTTAQKVKAIYSISFHDKEGKLIGCYQGVCGLNPKTDENFGSGIIYTDDKSIASVTSYKLKTQVVEAKKN